MSDNDIRNLGNDNEDAEYWSMMPQDAVPLLIAKYNLNEKDAFGLWYQHQDVQPLVDDVEFIETEEQLERFRQMVNAPDVIRRKLFGGLKKSTGSGPKAPDNEE